MRKSLFVLLLILGLVSCTQKKNDYGTFRIGVNRSIKSAPVVLASSLGYFKDEGLTVDIEVESSAVALMGKLFDGQYDLVCVPDYQAVVHSFSKSDFRIIAVLNRNQSRSLVMNGNSISDPSDLAGTRVGLAANSAADYSLYRILLFNDIPESSVNVVYYEPNTLPNALINGDIDSIIAWEPFTSIVLNTLGENAHVINAHYGRDMYWLLITRADILHARSDDVTALLGSLDRGITFLNKKPTEALASISSALSLSHESVLKEWDDYTFYLELPQSLLLSMEQQGIWYRNRMGKDTLVSDFLDLMDGEPLARRFPRRVSVVGTGGNNAP